MNNLIDLVVPMVFPQDVQWQRDLNHFVGKPYAVINSKDVRYRSWNMEQLQVRCIRKYMPFVGRIVVLLARDSQVQPWMLREENLKVVLHEEFIPKHLLPTFNSGTIEMFLHCIPDITPQFLYANDDMIPLSPLTYSDFFRPADGSVCCDTIAALPCLHFTTREAPRTPNIFHRRCLSGVNFVGKEFGRTFTASWPKSGHSIAPILTATAKHLWQRGGKEILEACSPFREPKNFNQYIYPWWHFMANKYVDYTPKSQYVGVRAGMEATIAAIRSKDPGILCINDNECMSNISHFALQVCNAIKNKLDE